MSRSVAQQQQGAVETRVGRQLLVAGFSCFPSCFPAYALPFSKAQPARHSFGQHICVAYASYLGTRFGALCHIW